MGEALSGAALIGQQVQQFRESQDLSVAELAVKSGVAARTISKIEAGDGARFDAIVRLALTLGQPPKGWLALLNLQVSDQQIAAILARANEELISNFQTKRPSQYFDSLLSRLHPNCQSLMSVLVHLRMPIRGKEAEEGTKNLLDRCMRFAVVSPFPLITSDIKIDLALQGYYLNTYAHAAESVQQIRDFLPWQRRNQIRLFRPAEGRVTLVHPPAALNELRPCLTRLSCPPEKTEGGQRTTYELSFYTRYTDGRPDAWTIVNPNAGIGEERSRAEEYFSLWRAYFSEIHNAWKLGESVEQDIVEFPENANWIEVTQ